MLLHRIYLLTTLLIILLLRCSLCYYKFSPNCEMKELKFIFNSCPTFDHNLFYNNNNYYNNSQHDFRNITRCRDTNSYESFNVNPIKAKNIRIIVIPSLNFSQSEFMLLLLFPFETIQKFANFHGYRFAG